MHNRKVTELSIEKNEMVNNLLFSLSLNLQKSAVFAASVATPSTITLL